MLTPNQFKIARRFRGPQDSGNGGYAAGHIAQRVDFEPARITLIKPPPLEQVLTIQQGERGLVACAADGAVIAACSPGSVELVIPPIPSIEDASKASSRYIMAETHFFPECFVCGTQRPTDGLCIHPGLLEDSDTVATTWTPDASLSQDGAVVDSVFVWAALDCPSGIACLAQRLRPIVLGKICVEIRAALLVGAEVIVMGWPVASDGIKQHVGAAIATPAGRIMAVASATWIELPEEQDSFVLGKRDGRS